VNLKHKFHSTAERGVCLLELKYRNNPIFYLGFIIVLGSVGCGILSVGIPFDAMHILIIIAFILGISTMLGAIVPYKDRADRLRRKGKRYEAQITDARYKNQGDFGSSFEVECTYTDYNNKLRSVKAKNLVPVEGMPAFSANDNFKAWVWVNPNDYNDYYVEIWYYDNKGMSYL